MKLLQLPSLTRDSLTKITVDDLNNMAKKFTLTSWYVCMAVSVHLIQQIGKRAMHLNCSTHDADSAGDST